MGRRAVRKPDPALDLGPWFLSLDDLPRPWDAARVFGRAAPLEVEVGSGKGLFLSTAPVARPEHDFLGIEVSRKYARHTAGRLAKRDLPNARIVCADAKRVFAEILPDVSLAAVHVYFPDPWWKARHKKRRMMSPEFVADVRRTLVPTGELHFWSDVEEYFQSTLEVVAANGGFSPAGEVAEQPSEHDLDYRTHFERRMRLGSEPVYRAVFRRLG